MDWSHGSTRQHCNSLHTFNPCCRSFTASLYDDDDGNIIDNDNGDGAEYDYDDPAVGLLQPRYMMMMMTMKKSPSWL